MFSRLHRDTHENVLGKTLSQEAGIMLSAHAVIEAQDEGLTVYRQREPLGLYGARVVHFDYF